MRKPSVYAGLRGLPDWENGKIVVRQKEKGKTRKGERVSNKSAGTAFEQEFAKRLAGYGFWVHRMQDNQNGQPFDLIAAKNKNTLVMDCKACQYEDFSLYRIEENQLNAMKLWQECGNIEGVFIIKTPKEIRVLKCSVAEYLIESGHRRLKGKKIFENTVSVGEWLNEYTDQQ